MDKNLFNNGQSGGKSLYNETSEGEINSDTLQEILNSLGGSSTQATTDQFGGVSTGGNQTFGVITADVSFTNTTSVAQKFTVGSNGLLRIVPLSQEKINDALVRDIMITTSNYVNSSSTGYTSVIVNIPYVFDDPDHATDADAREAPDNFFDVYNTKFRVSGPFTHVKSVKSSFKSPVIDLGYYDREESTLDGSTTLALKTYDKGIVFERVETEDAETSNIKKAFMGYSQELDRFIMYRDAIYTGTDAYYYKDKYGNDTSEQGIYSEYNVSRDPTASVTTSLEVDKVWANEIEASDNTGSRSLTLNSYDTMVIGVTRYPGDDDPDRNFDLELNVEGKIIVTSAGGQGTVQYSNFDYRIQSNTGTYLNAADPADSEYKEIPVYLGYQSMVEINDWGKATYLSTGVEERNTDTMVQIGGDFTAEGGVTAGSKLLIDGSITGESNNNIHAFYSNPTVYVPASNDINYVSNTTLQPQTIVLNDGSSVNTSSTLHVTGATSNASNNYAILSSDGEVRFMGSSSTGAYMSWDNDALNLYNAHIYINPQAGSFVPYLEIGTTGSQTNIYAIKRSGVDGTNELFVDGISTQVPLLDNTTYTVRGTVTGIQASGAKCSLDIYYCLTINNGIKTKEFEETRIRYCPVNDDDEYIFDVAVGFTGNATTYSSDDGLQFIGTNITSGDTNWFADIFVTILNSP